MSGNPRAIRLTLEAVIGRLLGIPASLSTDSKRWSDDLVGMVGGMSTNAEPRVAHLLEMFTFFHEAFARRHNLGEAHETASSVTTGPSTYW
jgi:cytochrome P450